MDKDGNPETILVYVGWDLVGDGLLKLPFIHALRHAYPKARITWVAGKRESVFAGVMAPMVHGLLDEVIEHAGIGASPLGLILRPLRGRSFDLIIDTQKVALASLCLWRVKHDRFISPFGKFFLSSTKPQADYVWPKHMMRQMLDLAELATGHAFSSPDYIELHLSQEIRSWAMERLEDGPSYVGFAPGSGGKPKCWPLERFIEAASAQVHLGRHPVFLLGPQETDWYRTIKKALPMARFPLQEELTHLWLPEYTVALGERMAVSVSNDSGVGHMLASSGKPLISLFGPTSPEKFTPVTDHLTLLRAQDFGAGNAMTQIPAAAVIEAIEKAVHRPHH